MQNLLKVLLNCTLSFVLAFCWPKEVIQSVQAIGWRSLFWLRMHGKSRGNGQGWKIFTGKDKVVGSNNNSLPHSGLLVINIYFSLSDKIHLVPPDSKEDTQSYLVRASVLNLRSSYQGLFRVSSDSFWSKRTKNKLLALCQGSPNPVLCSEIEQYKTKSAKRKGIWVKRNWAKASRTQRTCIIPSASICGICSFVCLGSLLTTLLRVFSVADHVTSA